jgi:hypothetical protein
MVKQGKICNGVGYSIAANLYNLIAKLVLIVSTANAGGRAVYSVGL